MRLIKRNGFFLENHLKELHRVLSAKLLLFSNSPFMARNVHDLRIVYICRQLKYFRFHISFFPNGKQRKVFVKIIDKQAGVVKGDGPHPVLLTWS